MKPKRERLPRIVAVEVIGDFSVRLTFDDRVVRELDLTDWLRGPIFEPLKDRARFAEVFVDEGGTIAWPNGADMDADVLYGTYDPWWMIDGRERGGR